MTRLDVALLSVLIVVLIALATIQERKYEREAMRPSAEGLVCQRTTAGMLCSPGGGQRLANRYTNNILLLSCSERVCWEVRPLNPFISRAAP